MTRRELIASASGMAMVSVIATMARGQTEPPAPAPAPPAAADPAEPQPFSFDILSEAMRQKAQRPAEGAPPLEGFLADLSYDDYRKINYRGDRARWIEPGQLFRAHAYHMGWLFKEPVQIHEVVEGQSRRLVFATDDFEYRDDLAGRVPAHAALPGVAGFRLHYPLNRADVHDELVSFVGASYFRALGRGNTYGLSARGLAINTGLPRAEEFPRFSAFYLEKPPTGSRVAVVNAALDSPSVTGAFRFEILPGETTVMEVTARLFFRADVEQLGIAPLTSMFFYGSNNRHSFDDYRPAVHDSDGLRIVRADGDILWRALNNPPRLSVSVFQELRPQSFGLYQRNRGFDDYQDAEAHYETRPSLAVEPLGDWGPGSVRLVEIPSDLEVNDNIVAFWVPEAPARAGEAREFRYRLRWGALAPSTADDIAHVAGTRAGHAGVSGTEAEPGSRKFVVDFAGGPLGNLPDSADVSPVVSIMNGEVISSALEKIAETPIWRLVLDVRGRPGGVTELQAHLAGYDRKLTENWLYQWVQE